MSWTTKWSIGFNLNRSPVLASFSSVYIVTPPVSIVKHHCSEFRRLSVQELGVCSEVEVVWGFFLLHALFVQYERSLSIVLACVGLMALGEMGEVDVMMILEVIVGDLFFSVQKSLGVVERRGSAELSAGPLL